MFTSFLYWVGAPCGDKDEWCGYGDCVDGGCVCDSGWSGDQCLTMDKTGNPEQPEQPDQPEQPQPGKSSMQNFGIPI